MMNSVERQSSKVLQKELDALETAIKQRQNVLQLLREISRNHMRRSNTGWFISIVAEWPGTLMAVLEGSKGRKWDELARQLEGELLLLKVDKRFKEQEIRNAAFNGGSHYADESPA